MPIALLWSASAAAYCPATPELTLAAANLALKAGDTDAVHQALACLIPVTTDLKDKAASCGQPTGLKMHIAPLAVPITTTPPGH